MSTASPIKTILPFDDYAKKGIIQFQLKNDNNLPLTGIFPKSIKYYINDGSSNKEYVFDSDLKEQFNFRELSNGTYRFDIYQNPYKKTYRLTGTKNADDTNCQTVFSWYSGFGYKTEYRTEEMSVLLQNDTPDTIYYKLFCKVFDSVETDSSSSENDYESSSSDTEYNPQNGKQYQWIISLVNITEDDETIIYTSEMSIYYKDSIPTTLTRYGIDLSGFSESEKENYIVFLTPNVEAELEIFSFPITLSIDNEDVILQATFSPERTFFDSEINDFDFIPTYSPIKSQFHSKKLEFLEVDTDNEKKSFISKIVPSFYVDANNEKKPIPFFVEFDNESSSSEMSDKSNAVEFISKISVCNFTYKSDISGNLTARELFNNFEINIPYTNYFLEITDVNSDGKKYIFNLYQAITTNADYTDNLINEPGKYYAKGCLIKSIEVENNNFEGEKRDTLTFETIKIEEEVFPNSRKILNFTFDKDIFNQLSYSMFIIENEVYQYDMNNILETCSFDYFMRNGEFFEFTVSSESNYDVQKEALLNLLDKDNLGYIKGDYYVMSCFTSANIDERDIVNGEILSMSRVPTFDKKEIIYFSNELIIENKQDFTFVNDEVSPDFQFKTKYELESREEIYFNDLIFERVEVANAATSVGEIYYDEDGESSSSGSDNEDYYGIQYPNIFDNGDDTTDNDIRIIYSGEEYNEDDSSSVSELATLIMPDDKKLDGEYYHFIFPFGQKLNLIPEILTIKGIASNSGTSEGQEAENANGRYYFVEGEGAGRYWKHETDDYYIRFEGNERLKVVTGKGTKLMQTNYVSNLKDKNASEFVSLTWGGGGVANNGGFYITYTEPEQKAGKTKQYYFKFYDKYGNVSSICFTEVEIYQVAPYNAFVKIKGSSGSSYYTGFQQKYNRFIPSEFVEISFGASSKTPLKYKIVTKSSSLATLDDSWKSLGKDGYKTQVVKLMPGTSQSLLLGSEYDCIIKIQFKDEAGNITPAEKEIKFISQLHRTENLNLVEESTEYSHELYSVSESLAEKLTKKRISTTEYSRSWNEIWFPETHGSPLLEDGTIDAVEAKKIANLSSGGADELSMYDKLALDQNGNLSTDAEGRYLQNMSAWNRSKKYTSNLNKLGLNGDENTYKYWIVDNTGNIEFKLEFEVFDFDGQETSVPANYSSPYAGDCLVVYDASAPGCTTESEDDYGNIKYTLKDSSKLKQLFALKGSYITGSNNPFKLISDEITGNLVATDSGFITPNITSTSRICLIPFSDSVGEGSGFKLKAGPKHWLEYVNYECIEKNGEFWVHQSPSDSNSKWKGCSQLQMNYSYYKSFATINREKSNVMFESYNDNVVLGTYTHYLYLYSNGINTYPFSYFQKDYNGNYPYYTDEEQISLEERNSIINTFMLFNDDIVDYSEPNFFVVYSGEVADKTVYYNFSNYKVEKEGRLSSNYTINKDTGILTFNGLTPLGRILGDYYYHTFYRLTSDGYGDLTFYDDTLVPASASNNYTDWTYVDLKLTNEGTNQLTDGTLKFLARGYITAGTVVDTVLDNNRPWDVQKGTVAETVQRTGAKFAQAYSALGTPSRGDAVNVIKSQTASFGTLDAKASKFVRVYWCIATNADGTSWINCTRGEKLFSAELSGKFYIFTTGA